MKELNILVDGLGNTKICDFGLAYQFKEGGEVQKLNQCCGTPGYWAPEMIKREDYTMMPDWFALGVILYKLMMRKSPFDALETEKFTPKPEWAVEKKKLGAAYVEP